MNESLKQLLKPLASLKLTVALLALSILLVFCATWAQIDKGIWAVVNEYFRTFVVWVPLRTFLPRSAEPMPWGFPIPGGYLLGPLLLLNLLAAHTTRFRMKATGDRLSFGLCLLAFGLALLVMFHVMHGPALVLGWAADRPWLSGWIAITVIGGLAYLPLLVALYLLFEKRAGIILIHGSLILLIVGEAITGNLAVEAQMPIYEGQTVNWVHDIREVELAVVERSAGAEAELDLIHAIPAVRLAAAARAKDPVIRLRDVPFDLRIEKYLSNSEIAVRPDPSDTMNGLGRLFEAVDVRQVAGVSADRVDYPAAVVSLWHDGQKLGQFLVTPHFTPQSMVFMLRNRPDLAREVIGPFWPGDQITPLPQPFHIGDRAFSLALRFRRHYKTYAVHLEKFSHDLYTGTTIPRNFSSDIRLMDAVHDEDRNVHIKMNHPLRYRGETFFQSGWLGDNYGTILQVVDNPGWQIPYIACILGGVGLLAHFGLHLWAFLKRLEL